MPLVPLTFSSDSGQYAGNFAAAFDGNTGTAAWLGNLPGNVFTSATFPRHYVNKIGLLWDGGTGPGLAIQLHDGATSVLFQTAVDLGLTGDSTYREYVLPVPIAATRITLIKAFNVNPINTSVFEASVFGDAELIAQGTSESLPLAGASVSGDLWEIWQNGQYVDSGDRYDQFGLFGWGVEAVSGTVALVSVPFDADLGSGYEVRTAGKIAYFAVTPGTPQPVLPPPSEQPMFIFSTGLLTIASRLPRPTMTRQSIGAPPANASPLAQAQDAALTTTADLTYTNAGNRQYLILDLGAAQEIGSVLLSHVTSTAALTVFASANLIADGNFAGATALPGVGNPAAPLNTQPLRFEATGGSVTGRYLYIVPGAAATIGNVEARGKNIPCASLQDIGLNFTFQSAEVRDPCWVNMYPAADAQFDMAVEVSATWAAFAEGAFSLLSGAMSATDATHTTLTGGATYRPKPFDLELVAQTADGKRVLFRGYDFKAEQTSLPFQRESFALPRFTAKLRHKDATFAPWRLMIEN